MTAAPIAFSASVGAADNSAGALPSVTSVGAGAMVLSTTATADMATLVADGASPTQAHVTAMNTAFGAFVAPVNIINGAATVSVVFDNTGVTTMNQLKAALNNILQQIAGSGLLKP